MLKLTWREIRKSLGRYLAIFAIVALGVGFFCGLRLTKTAMLRTMDNYALEQKLYDYRLISTLGFTGDDVANLQAANGVAQAEGAVWQDVLCAAAGKENLALKCMSLPDQVNLPFLKVGRLPENERECLADAWMLTEEQLGSTITVSAENDKDTLENFNITEFTVVGLVNSPLYVNYERGSTSIGSGSISGFFYVQPDALDMDYYTDIYLTLSTATGEVYSQAYIDAVDAAENEVTTACESRADARYHEVRDEAEQTLADAGKTLDEKDQELLDAQQKLADAQQDLDDGWQAYNDGVAELADARKEADEELADALRELQDGEQELKDNTRKLVDAKQELADGEQELADGWQEYYDGLSEYESQRDDALSQLADAKAQLDDGQSELSTQQAALTAQQTQLTAQQNALRAQKAQLDAQTAGIPPEYFTPEIIAAYQQIAAGQAQLDAGQAQLNEGQTKLDAAQAELDDGWATYNTSYQDAMGLLSDAEAELADGQRELAENQQKLEDAKQEVADGEKKIADGKQELADGWNDYYKGKADAQQEIADAEQELADAKIELEDGQRELTDAQQEVSDGQQKLADARVEYEDGQRELADLEYPTCYILGRDANVGYVCFESDSDIVRGVSRVFPIFFFLVAALVCMTTMTRMVEEQRTQIGVLKAMGYSKKSIMAVFFLYAGSASVLGCAVGALTGAYILPKLIWQAYNIMYGFATDCLWAFDWPLVLASSGAFLACALGATWYACNHELSQVAAELIRPKSPKAGKRILLERVTAVWRRIPFMHKVSIRNILRYKKRMVMMAIGIGGCTALLLTGFGIQDSIQHVVDYQYEEITLYDAAANFQDPVDEAFKAQFVSDCGTALDSCLFISQSSMDCSANNVTKSVYATVVDGGETQGFMDLHTDDVPVAYPGEGCCVINNGLAQTLDVSVGDTITLRDSDMNQATLEISAVFDNYVYNYLFLSAETFETQFGAAPECKQAWLQLPDGMDVHEASAVIASQDNVSNVSVNEDMRDRVNNMMQSLEYIVLLVVVCAGALAFIVLYNLTNINITERLRELATVKVLGFYDRETDSYIFRENMVLTALGVAVGVPMGIGLHAFVMSQIKIDMMAFDVRIAPLSYAYAAALTLIFGLAVNYVMHFKINRIDMAEALKSIE